MVSSILSGRLQLLGSLTDPALDSLFTGELRVALEALATKKNRSRSQTRSAAIRSAWRKEKLQALERQVAGFRQELNLHISVNLG